MSKDYFLVKDKNMASAIKLLTREVYYTFDNDDGSKCYSFVRTPEVERAYTEISILIKKFR